ncbi:hypothetical protein AAWM_01975 [Aspergillus awamori]|uniref:Uncharacterized protein n=1 Tax=Aspergillus awamori TaxID=105351 RepID=A0A401KI74_ASPAW|nr:hypothetical protein AAWM_01975 [Aspergillus awamori]GKZ52654.1 hypothetical protein AnigIFM49718_003304 [Aspergillus niger]
MTSPQTQQKRLKRTLLDMEEGPTSEMEEKAMPDMEEESIPDMEKESIPDIWTEGGPALYPTTQYLCQRQEYNEIVQHFWSMSFMALPHMRSIPADFKKGFSKINLEVHSWAWRFGEDKPMSHLSSGDKQAIIASLDGFCVQEDWDKIHSSLPPAARSVFGKVLLEAMLNQFIYKKFATSPFWFMDAKMDATDQPGDANFIRRLDYIYQRFREILPTNAAWWKSTLVSICTAEVQFVGGPRYSALGQPMHERRKALVKSYEEELWECRLFRLLLKDSLSQSLQTFRDDRLHLILELAAQEFIAGQAGLFGNLVVERLPELAKFDRHSDTMVDHWYHAGFEPQDGAPVLLVIRPRYSYHDTIMGMSWIPVPPVQLIQAEVVTGPAGPEEQARWAAAAGDHDPTQDERIDKEDVDNEGVEGEDEGKDGRKEEGEKPGEDDDNNNNNDDDVDENDNNDVDSSVDDA